MKKIVLYGAGKRGRKVAELLHEKKIEVTGFCDSFKSGNVIINGG